jgi:hypothetical protein
MFADEEEASMSEVIEVALVRYLRQRGRVFKVPLGLEEGSESK